MKAVLMSNWVPVVEQVYGHGRRERLAGLVDLHPPVITRDNFDGHAVVLAEAEVVFSTWAMLKLDGPLLERMPRLKAVFYAAGSVQGFARPLLERDIMVVSASVANGIPVAEYAVGQIILAAKGYWQNAAACATHAGRTGEPVSGPGNYEQTIALLGAGVIGCQVIERLRALGMTYRILVWDPFLSEERAAELGVEKVEALTEAFERAIVVSNHLANKEEIRGLIRGEHFRAMRPMATFINTGRGAQINEQEMCDVLAERDDLVALLDVTDPEPPKPDSPLFDRPNIHLTSHIAGAIKDERLRLSDYVIDQFENWQAGKPVEGAVTLAMLNTMA